jgi:beta-xylosidase
MKRRNNEIWFLSLYIPQKISPLIYIILCITIFIACTNNSEKFYTTYCNPININYTYSIVNTSKGLSYRSGADPTVVEFRGEYYMFVTRSFGYWHSKDLSHWNFIRPQSWYFESSNAPTAWSFKDSILIALGNPSGWQSIIYTDNPKIGTWKGIPSLVPFTLHDPALFVDDDGRVFVYEGSSNVYPIKGVELDPNNYFLPVGEIKDLINLEPEKHGWERFGENHSDILLGGFIEGPWMTKYNGKYYLQYAAPGTEWNVYGDGVYTSDDPLGPLTYQQYNPFSYKPGGFITGAGHGSTVKDPYGNYWHFVTTVVGINYKFERRIVQFPAGFDEDGQLYTNTAYGDYPNYIPSPKKRNREDWFTGWMLLSYQKHVRASSLQSNFKPENVVDENIKTFWVAKTNTKNEWLVIDLEKECVVKAIQINYSDYKSNIFGKRDAIYHQYLVEYSADGTNWNVLVDKRDNIEDVPNDYVELSAPKNARYIRFTNHHIPTPNLAISGLRIFGHGLGARPEKPIVFNVKRDSDRRDAVLKWSPVKNVQGYNIYFGIAPDKLYNSILVYADTTIQLKCLNVDVEYFFSIEAFNENGISQRTSIMKSD